ncbi:MAG: ABC transporter ATP-binding protein [Leptothrix ochracea]|uniref:ABC transporter ATP-binding protein n=1 Tax=Leptothrix ochracea TaxID=735331 RepID=UPI0034E2C7F2
MTRITLNAIRKSYDSGPEIIQGIDLSIQDGEFMVFVGPSGCGKSTLLRMIAGLESISQGQLLIGDQDATHRPPVERGVAMVFQSYALYPHMTVGDNMRFGLRINKVPKAEIAERVGRAAEILQISHLLDQYPRQLSGGQRQRVAIGRAIVRKPAVFLFDEPLSNLDANLRVQMRVELTRLHRELGTTMIYVTHDQTEAMTMGDRIAVFNGGHIEQVGAPLALYEAPDNTFVGQFLGSPKMNLLPASHEGLGPWRPFKTEQGVAHLGVRPEALVTVPTGQGWPVQVDVIEHLGDTTLVYLRVPGMEAPLCMKLACGRCDWQPGQALCIAPAPGGLHLFGADHRRITTL